MSDFNEYVAKAKSGDTDAFAELYSVVYKDLYYIALCNLNNPHDAADAVSDAVLDAFKSIKNLKNIDAFKAWMFKILNAKICRKQAEYVKQRNTTSDLAESYDQPGSDNPYSMIEILQQFNLLSEKERICFSLNLVCGYTSDEISKICGMRASSVRSLLSRGRQKLKEQIISD